MIIFEPHTVIRICDSGFLLLYQKSGWQKLVGRCRLTQSCPEEDTVCVESWIAQRRHGETMGRKLICRARSLPSRGVSSFLFSGGNEAGLQTVTRQLDPKKGILSEGKGKREGEHRAVSRDCPCYTSTCAILNFSGNSWWKGRLG